MIRKGHSTLSLVKQCKMLDIHRSGLYYKPQPESDFNLKLMREIDEHYLHHPFKGAKRMHIWLTRDKGYQVSKNRIERLYYRVMGLRAIMPGRHTSRRCKSHPVYPYLLRNLTIDRPNQVWATDITYIPMEKGYMYLVAIIDLYSRYVVNWSISNSMDAAWCRATLQDAIEMHGKPEIINTDQGSQFTAEEFSSFVLKQGIRLSMDGKGRATDNAFIERLWRNIKYEKLYLNPPTDGLDLYLKTAEYFNY
ncbi:IS3 family transposase [bacterium SCSIO 12741]|nr:IS3 family transposase [bacterium SCSIO 12741]UTW62874.1 IS3 family transposase [bacterium SCSIO 12741]